MMDVQRDYWMQLFANLLKASPVDTRNMITHIKMYETPDAYGILIEAPYATNPKCQRKGQTSSTYKQKTGKNSYKSTALHNYAGAVNYATKSPHRYWVENQIELTKQIMNGRDAF